MESYQDLICWMPVQEFIDIFLPCAPEEPSASSEKSKHKPNFWSSYANINEGGYGERDLFDALSATLAENLGITFGPSLVPHGAICASICDDVSFRHNFISGDSCVDLGHSVMMDDFGKGENERTTDSRGSHPWKSKSAERAFRRVLWNIANVLNRQQRTHVFHVVIAPSVARLLRMDRSGLVISEPIHLLKDCSNLLEFYKRHRQAPLDMRGHDISVQRATPDEIATAKPYLDKWAPSHSRDDHFYAFEVPNPAGSSSTDGDQQFRRVIGWEPLSATDSLAGRATRPYAVYDIESKQVCFLKDFWREDSSDFAKESEILRELNQHAVEHVPSLLAGDDLRGRYQRTLSQEFNSAPWRTCVSSKLVPRIHHRILEDYLPQSIKSFKTPRDVLKFARHALIAHQQAYERCQILHRDISTNNIRIRGDEEGVLADWDLSIKPRKHAEADQTAKPPPPHRVGTWNFLSAALALNPLRENNFQDDLESIYWIVLHLSLRYLPFTVKPTATYSQIENAIFNDKLPGAAGVTGGYRKRDILSEDSYELDFTGNDALNGWFHASSEMFEELYVYRANQRHNSIPNRVLPPRPLIYPTAMDNHNAFLSLTEHALGHCGWADKKTDNKHPPTKSSSLSSLGSGKLSSAPSDAESATSPAVSVKKRRRDDEEDSVASSSKRSRLCEKLCNDVQASDIHNGTASTTKPEIQKRRVDDPEQPCNSVVYVGPEASVGAGPSTSPNVKPAESQLRRSSRLRQGVGKTVALKPTVESKKGKAKQRAPPPQLGMTLRSADKGKKTSVPSPTLIKQSKKAPKAKPTLPQPPSKPARSRAARASKKEIEAMGRVPRPTARQLALAQARTAKQHEKSKRKQ